MEEYVGCLNGTPSRHRAFILRQNRIQTRHYALDKRGRPLHSNADMAAKAIQNAVHNSEVSLGQITYLATASSMNDVLLPGLASHVHAALGIPPIELANFQGVCASSLMMLKTAWLQVGSGQHQCAALSGSEFASRYFRPGFYERAAPVQALGYIPLEADFLRFTLSDGAGAVVVEPRPNTRRISLKVLWVDLRSYADRFETCMLGGGVRNGDSIKHWGDFGSPQQAADAGAFMLTQDFKLMKRMIPVWISHYLDLIDRGRITVSEIDHVCSHYSSHSLREEAMRLLKRSGAMIDEDKWFTNLYTKGNTGAASILVMLDELYRTGNLKPGERILCHVPESGRAMNGFMLLEVVDGQRTK
jgi:3-oxoacyl-[acyl-carrier-protein] synthase-3